MTKCPCCKRDKVGPIRQWRRRSSYVYTELNYINCCYHCIQEDDYQFYWDWNEYYSACGYPNYDPYRKRSQKEYVQ